VNFYIEVFASKRTVEESDNYIYYALLT